MLHLRHFTNSRPSLLHPEHFQTPRTPLLCPGHFQIFQDTLRYSRPPLFHPEHFLTFPGHHFFVHDISRPPVVFHPEHYTETKSAVQPEEFPGTFQLSRSRTSGSVLRCAPTVQQTQASRQAGETSTRVYETRKISLGVFASPGAWQRCSKLGYANWRGKKFTGGEGGGGEASGLETDKRERT